MSLAIAPDQVGASHRIHCMVGGTPRVQGSHRIAFNRKTRRRIVIHDDPRLAAWRDTVSIEARRAMRHSTVLNTKLTETPVHLELEFRLRKPKRTRRDAPFVRPDLDKLVRAVGDALEKIWYANDSQVCELIARKRYAEYPGVWIEMRWSA